MERMSYRAARSLIRSWNEHHPNHPMKVVAYDGWYRIVDENKDQEIIVEKNPGKLWESFCIWKNGFFTGMKVAEREIEVQKLLTEEE